MRKLGIIRSYPHQICLIFLIILGIGLTVTPSSAHIFTTGGSNFTPSELYELTNSSKIIEQNDSVIFFYDSVCGSCVPAQLYLETYNAEHPDVTVEMVDIIAKPGNEDRLNQYSHAYNHDFINVPVVFIGPVVLQGSDEIKTKFEGVYNWYNRNKSNN